MIAVFSRAIRSELLRDKLHYLGVEVGQCGMTEDRGEEEEKCLIITLTSILRECLTPIVFLRLRTELPTTNIQVILSSYESRIYLSSHHEFGR